jgi:hypothetical protein
MLLREGTNHRIHTWNKTYPVAFQSRNVVCKIVLVVAAQSAVPYVAGVRCFEDISFEKSSILILSNMWHRVFCVSYAV